MTIENVQKLRSEIRTNELKLFDLLDQENYFNRQISMTAYMRDQNNLNCLKCTAEHGVTDFADAGCCPFDDLFFDDIVNEQILSSYRHLNDLHQEIDTLLDVIDHQTNIFVSEYMVCKHDDTLCYNPQESAQV